MSTATSTRLTVSAHIAKPVAHAWKYWTGPEHAASPDRHCPHAENDLRVGGRFSSRMEARDGSAGFDFGGTYTEVGPQATIAYTMDDGRKYEVRFTREGDGTRMNVTFDAENENPGRCSAAAGRRSWTTSRPAPRHRTEPGAGRNGGIPFPKHKNTIRCANPC